MFRHLREGCDPFAGHARGKVREQIALVVGYRGSRYRGCVFQNETDEAANPTVEGAILAAARRAWGPVVLKWTRSTRTERGIHAAENVFLLTVASSMLEEPHVEAALVRELEGSEITLLAPVRPAPFHLFHKVYAGKKRVYRCLIPYHALVCDSDRIQMKLQREREDLCLFPVPSEFTPADVREFCSEHGVLVAESDITIVYHETNDRMGANIRLPSEVLALARRVLHAVTWHGQAVTALPAVELKVKTEVLRRVRAALRALRGPVKGFRSFHNFMFETSMDDPTAKRQLLHCAGGDFTTDVRVGEEEDWLGEWTSLAFSATDFGPQQLRRMLGALVAVTRGTEDLSYIERCFDTVVMPAPAAPAESIFLDSVDWGTSSRGVDWRSEAHVNSVTAESVRAMIASRVTTEAGQLWEEFLARLDSGLTRQHLSDELASAATAGDVTGIVSALARGAAVDHLNEYGQSASFLAACAGQAPAIKTLAARGADLTRPANGGVTPWRAALSKGHDEVVRELSAAGADEGCSLSIRESINCPIGATAVRVIPLGADHRGAGSTVVDGAFSEDFLQQLDKLWHTLPVAPKLKSSSTERAYFADVEGWLTRHIDAAVVAAALPDAAETMEHMRFLWYPEIGASLPAHVDLVRTDAGLRSTYTFLLYLEDCIEGGETTLLECLDADVGLASKGGLAPGSRAVVASVAPRRGRLFLMPHACPHSAAAVLTLPKVLIRGEVLPPRGDLGRVAKVVDCPLVTSAPGVKVFA